MSNHPRIEDRAAGNRLVRRLTGAAAVVARWLGYGHKTGTVVA